VTTLNLFFDTRSARNGAPHAAQVAAVLDICEWADQLPDIETSVGLPEHHGFDDGYLPSPIVLGSAIAGRTRHMRLQLVLIAPFYDPVRLAEDLAVLDLVCRGRLGLTLVAGYVGSEFAAFGIDPKLRGEKVAQAVAILKAAWSGEEFEHDGRKIRVTPRPYQEPRPNIVLGGSTRAAARRAVRIADGFWPTAGPRLLEIYREELRAAGKEPLTGSSAVGQFQTLIAVAEDPDRIWNVVGPFCMYETNSYHELQAAEWGPKITAAFGDPPAYPRVEHWKELRQSGRYLVLTPDECVAWAREHANTVTIHPLTSGIDPTVAWDSLKLIEHQVLPQLAED
jgi:alkanesulfonate monooxygenase SsuD/methylene tetrahydromethanopterin reductase-like flavin-dependent oxidoreductase (luciferase family)